MSDPASSEPTRPRWSELRRVGPLYRRYRWAYLGGLAAILAAVALRISVPTIFGRSIDQLREADGAAADELVALAAQGALAIAVVAILGAVVRTASRLLVLGTSRRAVHDVRNQVMDRLVTLSPSYFQGQQTGQIMSRAVNDVQFVQSLLGPVFMYLSETAALYLVALVFMSSISVTLTVVALIPFPFFLWRARKLTEAMVHPQSGEVIPAPALQPELAGDFGNLAAALAVGEWMWVDQPHRPDWGSLGPFTLHLRRSPESWCFRGVCRPGSPPPHVL